MRARPILRWTWRVGAGALALVALLALAGAAYQGVAASRDLGAHPAPGRLVAVGGHRLHLYCVGEGRPTVILDAGLFGSSLDWRTVQPEVARTTRACAYDRAGYGWSEPGPLPRTSLRIAEELHSLLANAGETGPYVLVGHSFGGFNVRVFAGRYPAEVAGVALVDASHEELPARLPAEARLGLERQAGWFRILPLMGRLGVARIAGWPLGMVAKYPEGLRPAAEAVGLRTQAFRAAAAEGLSFRESGEQARAAGPLPDVPLVVIAANPLRYEPMFLPPGMTPAELAPILGGLQQDLARLSPRSTQLVAEASGHYIHLDQPELVVGAVRRLIEDARR